MLIGYARVSKADGTQLLDLQRDALLGAGVDEERIYEDRASGRHDHRPGLEACLKALCQPGNTFVVWKLDRLGRNLKHLVTTVEELHDRGVGLRVLAGAEIDTTTANGRLVLGIFAALAEFERELIAERTRAGLVAARARGAWAAGPARWTWPRCAWRCTPWQTATPLCTTWRSASASPRRPCTCTSTATAR